MMTATASAHLASPSMIPDWVAIVRNLVIWLRWLRQHALATYLILEIGIVRGLGENEPVAYSIS